MYFVKTITLIFNSHILKIHYLHLVSHEDHIYLFIDIKSIRSVNWDFFSILEFGRWISRIRGGDGFDQINSFNSASIKIESWFLSAPAIVFYVHWSLRSRSCCWEFWFSRSLPCWLFNNTSQLKDLWVVTWKIDFDSNYLVSVFPFVTGQDGEKFRLSDPEQSKLLRFTVSLFSNNPLN